MSDIPRKLRRLVVARAGGCCEYCRLHSLSPIAAFPVDHIIPQSQGGLTVLENLALACSSCNARKWAHQNDVDPRTRKSVPLFNPRTQVWADHFRWSRKQPFQIEGKTACGRATVRRLQMNLPRIVAVRQLLAEVRIRFDVPS